MANPNQSPVQKNVNNQQEQEHIDRPERPSLVRRRLGDQTPNRPGFYRYWENDLNGAVEVRLSEGYSPVMNDGKSFHRDQINALQKTKWAGCVTRPSKNGWNQVLLEIPEEWHAELTQQDGEMVRRMEEAMFSRSPRSDIYIKEETNLTRG